jgi:DNA-binding NarL/FixJ family response regulator
MWRRRACGTVRRVGRTVLIVDDHAGFRAAARSLLVAAGFEVTGEAADGASAVAAACELRPEIVLLDVQLPDVNGFAVAEQLADLGVSAAVVLISTRSRASLRWRLDSYPGVRFISKSELSGEALAAVLED